MDPVDGRDWPDDRIPPEQERQPLSADISAPDEEEEEQQEPSNRRRRIIATTIFVLILLLLLCPVSKETKKRVERGRRLTAQIEPGEKKIGETAFRFLSGGPVVNFPGARRFIRATPLKISFTVRNLSNRTRNLGYAAIKLTDEHEQTYRIHPDLTQRWYESRQVELPWERDVKGNQRVQVEAVFLVRKGPVKIFRLEGRDLDWQAVKYIEVGGGKYATAF